MLYSLKNEPMTASKDNTQFPSTQHHSALGSVTFTLKISEVCCMAWFGLTSANVCRDPSLNFVAETWLPSTHSATYFETAMSPPGSKCGRRILSASRLVPSFSLTSISFELSLLSELCVVSSGALQTDMGAVFQPDAQGQRVRSTP